MQPSQETDYKIASINKRFINLIIDWTVIIIVVSIFMGILSNSIYHYSNTSTQELNYYTFLWMYPFSLIYYVIFESTSGKTLGKIITKTKVVRRASEEEPSFGSIVLRTLIRYIPIYKTIPIYPVTILFTRLRRSLHDILSSTLVVEDGKTGKLFKVVATLIYFVVALMFFNTMKTKCSEGCSILWN